VRVEELSWGVRMTRTIPCPFCGGVLYLRESQFGPEYRCERWPQCDSRVGAHKGGTRAGEPLGTPADSATRRMRRSAHIVFDKLWIDIEHMYQGTGNLALDKLRAIARRRTYRYLRERMGLTAGECHFAKFDKTQCRRAISILKSATPEKIRAHAKKGNPAPTAKSHKNGKHIKKYDKGRRVTRRQKTRQNSRNQGDNE